MFDLKTARNFTADLQARRDRCDHGEGLLCHNLEATIGIYVELCDEFRAFIGEWAKSIFQGSISYDPVVESLLKDQLAQLLRRSKQVAARGRGMFNDCYMFDSLNLLHYRIADLDFFLQNWVTPKLSVSPSPRVKLSSEATAEMLKRIQSLADAECN